jgi:hypothetical protein
VAFSFENIVRLDGDTCIDRRMATSIAVSLVRLQASQKFPSGPRAASPTSEYGEVNFVELDPVVRLIPRTYIPGQRQALMYQRESLPTGTRLVGSITRPISVVAPVVASNRTTASRVDRSPASR